MGILSAGSACMYDVEGNILTTTQCPVGAVACIVSAVGCDVVKSFNTPALLPSFIVADVPIAYLEMLPANASRITLKGNGISRVGDLRLDRDGKPSTTISLSLIDQTLMTLDRSTRFPPTLQSLSLARSSLTAIRNTSFPITLTSLDLSYSILHEFVVDPLSFRTLSRLTSFGTNVTINVSSSTCSSIPGASFESVQNGRFFLCVVNTTMSNGNNAATMMHDPTTSIPSHAITGDASTLPSPSSLVVTIALVSVLVVGVIVVVFCLVRRRHASSSPFFPTSRTTRRLSSSFFLNSPPKATIRGSLVGLHDVRFDPAVASARLARSDLRSVHTVHADGLAIVSFGYWKVHVPVTIRQLQPNTPVSSIATFMDEVQTCVSIVHDHVVPCVGVAWSTSSDIAIVSEHMEGGTLQSHMAQYGHTRQFHAAKWVVAFQIADALVYLHAQSIIYRTLHAESVLLSADGHPKLSNHGLRRTNRRRNDGGGVSLVWSHLASTAPELLNRGDHTSASDVYALGVLLCELDKGTSFSSVDAKGEETLRGDVERIVLGKFQPEISSSCPEDIAALIRACVHVNPTERPTAEAVLHALRPFNQDASGAVEV
ncbi:serine/threonine protein kinase [Aphanomyces astaci]|uniref:Serine/threonine protein kinase n=1 Tax=Aphanomyces astaci TaxID=112090 RepID=W4H463_APHAT|nr:serine/threonine protein kinase [Aphanomyces astaci]ETV86391.1 serine/threonine protein kinase [Aphanomyces astaci]|eukprot:XP_009824863.1 serine/threonine protein kinase [Aphanomyces astaci]